MLKPASLINAGLIAGKSGELAMAEAWRVNFEFVVKGQSQIALPDGGSVEGNLGSSMIEFELNEQCVNWTWEPDAVAIAPP